MINFETLNLKKEKDIATIALARPNAINAINIQMRDDLYEALTAVKEDPEIRALIFYGKGTKGFCSGADIYDFGKAPSQTIARQVKRQRDVWRLLANLEKPTISAIHGICFGAGLELASFCDIRIATSNSSFAMPEVNLGLMPAAGGTQLLPRMIGTSQALDLLLTGSKINGEMAFSYGLVSKVVEKNDLIDTAERILQNILNNPDNLIHAYNRAVVGGLDLSLSGGLALEKRLSSFEKW